MKPSLRLRLVVSAALVCLAVAHADSAPPHGRLPSSLCGVSAGRTVDSEVTKRFGKGYFVADEDHLGGRYFVDPKHRITLHTTIGVDRVIFTVELTEGVRLPSRSALALRRAETRALEPPKTLFRSLRLRDSAEAVRRAMGRPEEVPAPRGLRAIRYSAPESDEELDHHVEFRFRSDRLVSVLIYNGE